MNEHIVRIFGAVTMLIALAFGWMGLWMPLQPGTPQAFPFNSPLYPMLPLITVPILLGLGGFLVIGGDVSPTAPTTKRI